MSNPFGDSLDTSGVKVAGEEDRLGGFQLYDSNLYPGTIKLAYFGQSDSGAKSMTFEVDLDNGGKYSWTEWVTSGTTKGGKSYTENDKGEKQYLPGYNRANAICLFINEKELGAQTFEEKVIKKYSKAASGEVPTPVKMATSLLGGRVLLGIQRVIKNKEVFVEGKGYVKTNDKREVNEVDKVFQPDTRRTLKEAIAKAETAEFADKWLAANKEPRNAFKHQDNAPAAGTPGATTGDKPTTSLFG